MHIIRTTCLEGKCPFCQWAESRLQAKLDEAILEALELEEEQG